MQIIYGYSNCSNKKYKEYFEQNKDVSFQPNQKYHSLLIKGFSAAGANILCLSGLPVNRNNSKKLFINEPDEIEENAIFHYYKTLNIPVIRQLMIFIGAFIKVLITSKSNQTVAICDYLSIANSYGILFACRLKKIPVITIVTDLADMFEARKSLSKLNNMLLQMVDGFIFLTKQMNERINSHNKPYIILEGHVDANLEMPNSGESFEENCGKKVIIYAGSIQRLYGIPNLVEGFIKANIPNAEIHIFGDGDYREELEIIVRRQGNVKYMGNCSNQEVVAQEQRAMLLVNPRPIAPEYTKYSFPSKNMEYMVSGTPTLTTKLPGMPEEYYPYVYFIEDESPDGIANVLKQICELPRKERVQKGLEARAFVLEQKSNIMQAKKILIFLKNFFEAV